AASIDGPQVAGSKHGRITGTSVPESRADAARHQHPVPAGEVLQSGHALPIHGGLGELAHRLPLAIAVFDDEDAADAQEPHGLVADLSSDLQSVGTKTVKGLRG